MSNKSLSSLEERLKEHFDKEGNENNDYVGLIYEELGKFKISSPEEKINKILRVAINLMEYAGIKFNSSAYINDLEPLEYNTFDNQYSIREINDFYNQLTEEEKYLYWEFSIKKDNFLMVEHIFQSSVDLNLRELFIRGINEKWIKSNAIVFFSRIFLITILRKLISTNKIISANPSVWIKSIKLPQVNSLPSGELSELGKVNIFIGKNNQSKSRFLKFIKVLLLALSDLYEFSQKFGNIDLLVS